MRTVQEEDKSLGVGLDEIEAVTKGIRKGSGVPAIVIYIDDMEDAIKINMASFNMDRAGVLVALIQAARMLGEEMQVGMQAETLQ